MDAGITTGTNTPLLLPSYWVSFHRLAFIIGNTTPNNLATLSYRT